MKFAIAGASLGRFAEPQPAIQLARAAEAHGFESLWTADRVAIATEDSTSSPYSDSQQRAADMVAYPDSLVWIAHVAAATTSLRFGTGVLLAPLYDPVLLARAATSVDRLSDGRFQLGVGLGWSRASYETLGVPWTERGARLDDCIGAMRALWSGELASYDGRFTRFERIRSNPRPIQPGGVPIVVGGHSRTAAARAGRVGDGYYIGGHDFDALPDLVDIMRSSARDAGRDPDAIEVTYTGDWEPDTARRYADAGIHRMALPPPRVELGELDDHLARYHEQTIAPLDHA